MSETELEKIFRENRKSITEVVGEIKDWVIQNHESQVTLLSSFFSNFLHENRVFKTSFHIFMVICATAEVLSARNSKHVEVASLLSTHIKELFSRCLIPKENQQQLQPKHVDNLTKILGKWERRELFDKELLDEVKAIIESRPAMPRGVIASEKGEDDIDTKHETVISTVVSREETNLLRCCTIYNIIVDFVKPPIEIAMSGYAVLQTIASRIDLPYDEHGLYSLAALIVSSKFLSDKYGVVRIGVIIRGYWNAVHKIDHLRVEIVDDVHQREIFRGRVIKVEMIILETLGFDFESISLNELFIKLHRIMKRLGLDDVILQNTRKVFEHPSFGFSKYCIGGEDVKHTIIAALVISQKHSTFEQKQEWCKDLKADISLVDKKVKDLELVIEKWNSDVLPILSSELIGKYPLSPNPSRNSSSFISSPSKVKREIAPSITSTSLALPESNNLESLKFNSTVSQITPFVPVAPNLTIPVAPPKVNPFLCPVVAMQTPSSIGLTSSLAAQVDQSINNMNPNVMLCQEIPSGVENMNVNPGDGAYRHSEILHNHYDSYDYGAHYSYPYSSHVGEDYAVYDQGNYNYSESGVWYNNHTNYTLESSNKRDSTSATSDHDNRNRRSLDATSSSSSSSSSSSKRKEDDTNHSRSDIKNSNHKTGSNNDKDNKSRSNRDEQYWERRHTDRTIDRDWDSRYGNNDNAKDRGKTRHEGRDRDELNDKYGPGSSSTSYRNQDKSQYEPRSSEDRRRIGGGEDRQREVETKERAVREENERGRRSVDAGRDSGRDRASRSTDRGRGDRNHRDNNPDEVNLNRVDTTDSKKDPNIESTQRHTEKVTYDERSRSARRSRSDSREKQRSNHSRGRDELNDKYGPRKTRNSTGTFSSNENDEKEGKRGRSVDIEKNEDSEKWQSKLRSKKSKFSDSSSFDAKNIVENAESSSTIAAITSTIDVTTPFALGLYSLGNLGHLLGSTVEITKSDTESLGLSSNGEQTHPSSDPPLPRPPTPPPPPPTSIAPSLLFDPTYALPQHPPLPLPPSPPRPPPPPEQDEYDPLQVSMEWDDEIAQILGLTPKSSSASHTIGDTASNATKIKVSKGADDDGDVEME